MFSHAKPSKKTVSTLARPVVHGKENKQKSRVSQEYRKHEEHVQSVLKKAGIPVGGAPAAQDKTGTAPVPDVVEENKTQTETGDDELSKSVQFFCKMWNDNEPLPQQSHGKRLVFDPWNNSEEERNQRSGEGSEANKTPSEGSCTASTFIQIDALDLEVIQPLAMVRMVRNNEDLYKPSENLPANVATHTEGMSRETLRLVNRLYTEAHESGKKVSKNVIKKLREADKKSTAKPAKKVQRIRSNCGHKFHPVFCEPSPEAAEVPPRRFVRIYMKDVCFTNHPQILEEHIIANELDDLCVEYGKRLKGLVCERLEAELQTERKIVSGLLAKVSGEGGRSKERLKEKPHPKKLEKHLVAVKALRNRLHMEEATNKRLLGDILNTWVRLKTIRRTQDYQCTRLRLKIKVDESSDIITRSQRWSQRYETELNEIYRERLEEYYRRKRDWKKNLEHQQVYSHPPIKPDIIQLAEELKTQLTEFSYLPTEPKVDVLLCRLNDEEFYELQPLRAKKLRSYFMKIEFDQVVVGETKSCRMETDMRVAFNEAIGIFLERRMPRRVRFSIFEKSKLGQPKKIGHVNVPITYEMTEGYAKSEMRTLAFDPRNSTPFTQQYSGKLSVKLHFEREFFCPTLMTKDIFPRHTADGNSNSQYGSNRTFVVRGDLGSALEDCVGDGPVIGAGGATSDDEDNVSQKSDTTLTPDTPKDTCTFEEEQFNFCDVHNLFENQRLKLLQSRYMQSDARTKSMKLIPALDGELMGVDDDDMGSHDQVIMLGSWMDRIDVYKHEGKKYIRVLYEAIRTQCRRMNKIKSNGEDLVIGDDPTQWTSFFQALGWKFPKKHTSNHSNSLAADLANMPNFYRIVLNVVRATGIPVRDSYRGDPKTVTNSEANVYLNQNIKYSNVKPFVRFGYRDKHTCSTTAEGSNPTWNEELQLNLSGALSDLHYDVTVSLFDEFIENHMSDVGGILTPDSYQKVQLNYLAECRIPISALIERKKIDGVFELTMPKVLVGYKSPSLDTSMANPNDSTLHVDPEIKENIYMWFYLSFEPAAKLPTIDTSCLECSELRDVRLQLDLWSLQVKQLQPGRFIDPLVCTSQGKRVCLTRLLGAIPLPVEATENLLESACRFVSLLHVLENYDECMGFKGVWLNNQVLLDSTACSPKDLGVLLCNYMLTIGMPCWLVLGMGNPYGEMAFVLYRNDEDDWSLIDPNTGKHYSTRDTFCPLLQVFYVVATDNIYCNIQREQRVSLTSFNLKESSCWLPAFTKKSPAPLGGVQKLNYAYTQSHDVQDLKCTIERKIKKKIASWRSMRKTTWNRAFQARMQNILEDLEESVTFVGSDGGSITNVTHQLAAQFPDYSVYGFTLNFPYTKLSTISELVRTTGIQGYNDMNVEFALAVHLKVYPNNVLSVWVLIMTLVPLH